MSQLLEVASEHLLALEHDERLSPDERTFFETVSLALIAMRSGTDVWTMEAEALAEDVALTGQQAAEAKRNAAEAKHLASRAARIASNRRQAPAKKGKRRMVGKVKTPTRRAA